MTSDGLSEHDHQHKQTNNDDAMDLSRIYGLRVFSAVGPMVWTVYAYRFLVGKMNEIVFCWERKGPSVGALKRDGRQVSASAVHVGEHPRCLCAQIVHCGLVSSVDALNDIGRRGAS